MYKDILDHVRDLPEVLNSPWSILHILDLQGTLLSQVSFFFLHILDVPAVLNSTLDISGVLVPIKDMIIQNGDPKEFI